MPGLLGENINTFQRANPMEGLLRGLEAGSKFGLALRQQKAQEEQQRIDNAVQKMRASAEMYTKVKSVVGRQQYLQAWTDAAIEAGVLEPGTVAQPDENSDKYMSKIRGLAKLPPDMYLKETSNLKDELAEELDQERITEEEYKNLGEGFADVSKEVGAKIASDITYPEQFRGDPAYETSEAKTGIDQYQKNLLSQLYEVSPDEAHKLDKLRGADKKTGQRAVKTRAEIEREVVASAAKKGSVSLEEQEEVFRQRKERKKLGIPERAKYMIKVNGKTFYSTASQSTLDEGRKNRDKKGLKKIIMYEVK